MILLPPAICDFSLLVFSTLNVLKQYGGVPADRCFVPRLAKKRVELRRYHNTILPHEVRGSCWSNYHAHLFHRARSFLVGFQKKNPVCSVLCPNPLFADVRAPPPTPRATLPPSRSEARLGRDFDRAGCADAAHVLHRAGARQQARPPRGFVPGSGRTSRRHILQVREKRGTTDQSRAERYAPTGRGCAHGMSRTYCAWGRITHVCN